jgi:hypothetical protein
LFQIWFCRDCGQPPGINCAARKGRCHNCPKTGHFPAKVWWFKNAVTGNLFLEVPWDTRRICPDLLHLTGFSARSGPGKTTRQRKRVSAVKKSVLIVFCLIGLGVAGYFILPLTPIPDYVSAVFDRADKLF